MTDMDTTRTMIDLLERFCDGFASGDAEAVAATCNMTVELAIVTSEELVLRGGEAFAAFLDRYMRGNTRYAWAWDRHDVATYGDVAWLLAIGTETATITVDRRIDTDAHRRGPGPPGRRARHHAAIHLL